jgi:hypothetical protein
MQRSSRVVRYAVVIGYGWAPEPWLVQTGRATSDVVPALGADGRLVACRDAPGQREVPEGRILRMQGE